jgi:hypothetical protein
MSYVDTWKIAFVWTQAIELPVYVLLLRRQFSHWYSPVLLSLFVNAVTHPLLWFVFPVFDPYPLWLLVGESSVVIVEALLVAAALRFRHNRRAILAALASNAISTALGFLVMR